MRRKLVFFGIVGLLALGLDRMFSKPKTTSLNSNQTLSFNSPNDWDRIKELFH